MKNKLLWSVALLFVSSLSFAQGNNVGGGGTVIITDDDIIMSEAFKKEKTPVPVGTLMTLGEPLKNELKRIEQLMRFHSGYFYSETPLFSKNILSDSTQYILLSDAEFEKAKERCPFWQRNVDKPTDSIQKDIGCTVKEKTYILESVFAQMTLRRQAEFLLHERLMATQLSSEWDVDYILGQINRGIDVALKQLDQEVKGEFRRLSDEDFASLKELGPTIVKYKLLSGAEKNTVMPSYYGSYFGNPTKAIEIHQNGGGLYVKGAKIDPNAYLGVHTLFYGVAKNGSVFVSEAKQHCDQCVLEENAVLAFNSVDRPDPHAFFMGQYMKDFWLHQSSFHDHFKVYLAPSAKLVRNHIADRRVSRKLQPSETELFIALSEGSSIVDSRVSVSYKGVLSEASLFFDHTSLSKSELDVYFTRRNQRTWNYISGPLVLPAAVGAGIVIGLATVPWIGQWGDNHPTNRIEDWVNRFGTNGVTLYADQFKGENLKLNVRTHRNEEMVVPIK